jgi:hypothetical protein
MMSILVSLSLVVKFLIELLLLGLVVSHRLVCWLVSWLGCILLSLLVGKLFRLL